MFVELKELVVLALAQLPRQLVGEILLPSRRRFKVVQDVENFGVNRRRHAVAGSALKLAVGIFPPFFQVDFRYGRPAARPGANFIKLFFFVIYKSRVIVPGSLFQPSLMFASKAGAYPSGAQAIL